MKAAAALLATLLAAPALAAPGATDVERAATRAAQALDGVLRGCPATFSRVGSADKKCVGVRSTVEEARTRLGATLGNDLYGVWRSRDEQRSVYNWVRTPGGYVYLRLQPDPEGRAQTLIYLDTPPESAAPKPEQRTEDTRTPAPGTATSSARPAATPPASRVTPPRPAAPSRGTAAPAQTTGTPTRTPATTPPATDTPPPTGTQARVPFARPLQLQAQRMNGEDVRALQNRLIALTRPSGGGRGDGWYGPVTAATVRAFQAANGLPVTGRVDRATWDAVFSEQARTFPASNIR